MSCRRFRHRGVERLHALKASVLHLVCSLNQYMYTGLDLHVDVGLKWAMLQLMIACHATSMCPTICSCRPMSLESVQPCPTVLISPRSLTLVGHVCTAVTLLTNLTRIKCRPGHASYLMPATTNDAVSEPLEMANGLRTQ